MSVYFKWSSMHKYFLMISWSDIIVLFFFPKQIYKNRKCTVRGPISQQGTWMWRLSGTAKHFKYAILGKLLKFFQLWFYHLKIGDNNST